MPSGSELVCGWNHSRLASHPSRLRVSSRRRSRTAGTIPGRPRRRSCRAAGRGRPRARPGSAPPSPASGSPGGLGHSTGCGHDGRERRLGRGRERTCAANSSRVCVPGSSPASRRCAHRPFSFGTAPAAVSAWRVSMQARAGPPGPSSRGSGRPASTPPGRSVRPRAQPLDERDRGLGLARHACFLHHRPGPVDRADRALFQRNVQSGEALHGCSSSMLVADARGPRSTVPVGQPPPPPGAPITPPVRVRIGLRSPPEGGATGGGARSLGAGAADGIRTGTRAGLGPGLEGWWRRARRGRSRHGRRGPARRGAGVRRRSGGWWARPRGPRVRTPARPAGRRGGRRRGGH